MIILIATISVMVAFFATQAIMGSPREEEVKVKVIEPIDASITPPDPAIFNSEAINPAVKVEIDAKANTGP